MKTVLTLALLLLAPLAVAQTVDQIVVNSDRSQLRALTEQTAKIAPLAIDVSGTNSAHTIAPMSGVMKFCSDTIKGAVPLEVGSEKYNEIIALVEGN